MCSAYESRTHHLVGDEWKDPKETVTVDDLRKILPAVLRVIESITESNSSNLQACRRLAGLCDEIKDRIRPRPGPFVPPAPEEETPAQ